MTKNKLYSFCPKCRARVGVTQNTYTSSPARQACAARCGWDAPLPAWYVSALERERVQATKPTIETKGEES